MCCLHISIRHEGGSVCVCVCVYAIRYEIMLIYLGFLGTHSLNITMQFSLSVRKIEFQ